ncbi:uncharacterized protein LOC111241503 [Vigna radiata var. radiata]|uniref:Uncharacterized protein LOC111241503 n=1 Tax=Vigna radiata var. radiata TaxID=3916 RepID=A0A3Q0EVM9_VIGRR|nr:uncharacterized protein LOC111241503 [Vigna radiata var. radiata]
MVPCKSNLWAYERLGLYAHSSHRVFPRILRFHSFDYNIEQIDALLKKGKVHFDWHLSSEDRINPIIRAALNLDVVGRAEGSSPEGEALEKEGDGSFKGSKLAAVDKIRINNQRIRTIRNEIAVVRKELQDLRKLRSFGYVDNQGVDCEVKEDFVPQQVPDEDCALAELSGEAADEGFGEANEAADDATAGEAKEAVVDEGVAYEGPAKVFSATEGGTDEGLANEGHANGGAAAEVAGSKTHVDEECPGEGHEGAANEGPAHEGCEAHEELGTNADEEASAHSHEEGADDIGDDDEKASGHPSPLIDIGDHDEGGQVEPKVVVPLRSYNGDPRTSVDLDMLYNTVTRRDIEMRYVSEIIGQLLTTTDCNTLGPRQYVDNMVIMLLIQINVLIQF